MEISKTIKNTITALVVLLVVLLLALNTWMYTQQPGMLFYPMSEFIATPDNWQMQYEDVSFKTADDIRLHGWYFPQKDARRVVLFFHGNGGNISHREDSIKIFHQLGFNVFIFDYRGYGKSEGKPSEAGLYEDARSVWRYLNEYGFIPKQIIVFGRSLGGAVAANLVSELSAQQQPAYLVLESTFSSVTDMARYSMPVLSEIIYFRYHFDTVSKMPGISSPVLVLHSRDDDIIPFVFGKAVYEAANDNKAFAIMYGDHNSGFVQSQPGYQQTLQHFLQ